MAAKFTEGRRKILESDSKALSNMAQKYNDSIDRDIFDALIDAREKILRKLGKGTKA